MNLNLMVLDDFVPYLVKKEKYFGGIHYVYMFPNGYGASIIKNRGSYGHEQDLWELAVIEAFEDGKYELTYETPIADYVIGYLPDDKVNILLRSIMNLERRTKK